MSAPEINWDRIRDIDDCITPTRDHPDSEWLDRIPFGSHVVDGDGHRFRLLGWGSVQGSVILADRYRRQFHADTRTLLKVAS